MYERMEHVISCSGKVIFDHKLLYPFNFTFTFTLLYISLLTYYQQLYRNCWKTLSGILFSFILVIYSALEVTNDNRAL